MLRTTSEKIRQLAIFLRNKTELSFSTLVDIAVTDKLSSTGRFVITYLFLSSANNSRISVQIYAEERTTIPSLTAPLFNNQKIFAAAG